MYVITDPRELKQHEGCVFVPTMGALHAGHLSLIDRGKAWDSPLVVSIFVNPEQFAPDEDFETYPRDLEGDIKLAEQAGADIVFAPNVETIYPKAPEKIGLPQVATTPLLEDACRPSHFQGVCAVVARLFDLVQPSAAIFGEKDYQQLQVIRQLVEQEDRWGDLEIVSAPIIREADGLAMSSRNANLSDTQRAAATCLFQATQCSNEEEMTALIEDARFTVQYAVIRDAKTLLEPIDGRESRVLVAAQTGGIRLIDNGPYQQ